MHLQLRTPLHFIAAGLGALMILMTGAQADVDIASWNIRNLGWNNDKNYELLGEVGANFDIIAVQETMNEEGLSRFLESLETATGEDWSAMASHAIGRGSYKEHYAFVWRSSEVEYIDQAVVYLDNNDVFAREPFSARFLDRDSGRSFALASIHVIYGDSRMDRIPEIEALAGYWSWLHDVHADADIVLLAGDFNMTPNEPAWDRLETYAELLITDNATTLSTRDGDYANLYDNLVVPLGDDLPLMNPGILEAPQILGMSHEAFRESVSDHVPVAVTLDFDGGALDTGEAVDELPAPEALANNGDDRAEARPAGKSQDQKESENSLFANKNSGIYHWPGCPGYAATAEENRIYLESQEEAEARGYRAAKNC